MKNNTKHGLLFLSGAIICAILFLFFWNVQIFDDLINDSGPLTLKGSVNAIRMGFCHCVLQWIIFISAFTLLTTSIYVFCDDNYMYSDINIKRKWFIVPGVIILCWIISPVGSIVKLYNKNIEYVNQLDKQQYARKMFFDKLWKVYLQKYEICELNKNTFLEVTSMIMEGRHDGAQVTWKWLQENQNIPYSEFTKFYSDLSEFVNGQREEYYKLEEACMETVRQQNSMLDSFPNVMYNKVLSIQKLQYDPGFTSTHTEHVFKTNKEDI